MADRALGFAAAAHAELAEPAARLRLRGRRSRRLPHDAGDHRLHRPLRRAYRGAGADATRPSPRCAAPTTATWSPPTGATGTAGPWCLRPAPATSPASRRSPRRCRPRSRRSRRTRYRNPGQLADGGVLVVGASATGIQIADEIHRSGRPVTLAVGEHVRAPRTLPRQGHPVVDGCRRRARRALRRVDDIAGRAACRRCSSPARRSARPSISTR